MGANRPAGAGAARGAMRDPRVPRWRASAAQTLPGAPVAPMRPTREGRAVVAASGVARRLQCPALWRHALLTGSKNRRKTHCGEMSPFY